MSRIHAHRTIEAAQVVRNLLPIGNILPATESQARPLASKSLSAEQQAEAWQRAVETAPKDDNGKPKITAAHVERVVKEIRHPLDALFSSSTDECNTPQEIIQRVVRVLGQIDLDPCSDSHLSPNVPATSHYTKEDDGLSRQWFGRVYMNPPYGRELPGWIEHLCTEYEAGRVVEAVALIPSRTDTAWFRRLKQYPRCFIWGRLKFNGQETSAPFPSMAVYLGSGLERFIEVFGEIGDVYGLL